MSFRLVLKSSVQGPRDATGILYNCEVEMLQQMLKFKTSCAILAYISSNLLNKVGLSFFRYFEVGLRVCDIVVKKFTFAISFPEEFLYFQHGFLLLVFHGDHGSESHHFCAVGIRQTDGQTDDISIAYCPQRLWRGITVTADSTAVSTGMCMSCQLSPVHIQQQRRSNVRLCRSNIRLCSIRQCCLDNVAGVDGALRFRLMIRYHTLFK